MPTDSGRLAYRHELLCHGRQLKMNEGGRERGGTRREGEGGGGEQINYRN